MSSGRNILQTIQFARKDDSGEIAPSLNVGDDPVSSLQSLGRKDLLDLFKDRCSEPTSIEELEGEWNGVLLDNNGLVMTRVSGFLTHGLFGKGKRWMGKSFKNSKTGENRFLVSPNANVGCHTFECRIAESRLLSGKSSLVLDYQTSQSRVSLWRTMVDELRVLKTNDDEVDVMIGLGSMAWSGGVWNSAPFCLHKKKDSNSKR